MSIGNHGKPESMRNHELEITLWIAIQGQHNMNNKDKDSEKKLSHLRIKPQD